MKKFLSVIMIFVMALSVLAMSAFAATTMEVAPSTEITFDLYGKLSKLSSKFKELFGKAPEQAPAYAAAGAPDTYSTQDSESENKPKFCQKCGASTEGTGKFCVKCGEKI